MLRTVNTGRPGLYSFRILHSSAAGGARCCWWAQALLPADLSNERRDVLMRRGSSAWLRWDIRGKDRAARFRVPGYRLEWGPGEKSLSVCVYGFCGGGGAAASPDR
ncbi:hypothetical protein PLESTB_000943400 [Pleodorina starrii]|uniref:Uncharacterized protein n=1 Tax=Pleodorina starrii TaxID=330485 RepID=A0A9W6BMX3_9CHLO|nr:hypothetical protein PLESTB_000943400 [Pleodorina starrii]GLC71149.1 hypothetical protein PLESTF_001079800 [Pleodorina starrii]